MTSYCTRCLRQIPPGEMDDYLRNDHLGDCCAGEGDSEHAERTASLPEVEG